MHLVHTNHVPQYLSNSIQCRVLPVNLVSDPPTYRQLFTSSQGAEPSSASLMLDLLHETVLRNISIILVTLVFTSAASKLNYFVGHVSLVLFRAPGRSTNKAIQIIIIM